MTRSKEFIEAYPLSDITEKNKNRRDDYTPNMFFDNDNKSPKPPKYEHREPLKASSPFVAQISRRGTTYADLVDKKNNERSRSYVRHKIICRRASSWKVLTSPTKSPKLPKSPI